MRPLRLVAAVTAAVLVVGYGVADALDVAPGLITLESAPASVPARPLASDPARQSAGAVLPGLSSTAPVPSAAGLTRTLGPLLAARALGKSTSLAVVDVATSEVLLDRAAAVPRTPASTVKLLTAAAALSAVGGSTQLPTRVVQGASADEVILVGGGDILLTPGASQPESTVGRAGLATLAAQAAAQLRSTGHRHVVVGFDDSLFEGPNASPAWSSADLQVGFTARISPLGLVGDRARLGRASATDPALATARSFVAALRRQGIAVTATPARTRADDEAPVLAEVRSATVAELVELALTTSDNTLAEVLARLSAHSMGRPTTFQDAAVAVVDRVQSLGVDTGPAHLADSSGLGRGSVVPARALAHLLAVSAGPDHPELRPLLDGLPVSGFTGTLATRFAKPPAHAAAGTVRAKTGTLTGVNSLAGVTVDADGRLLAFALMSDQVPVGGSASARAAADLVAGALSACGCR